MQPHRLQELCRFRIRECIRQNILREVSDYFDVKREKSTFNPNLKESVEEERHSDEVYTSDTENETESPSENYPIIRIGRLFHIENHLQAQLRHFMNGLFSNFRFKSFNLSYPFCTNKSFLFEFSNRLK